MVEQFVAGITRPEVLRGFQQIHRSDYVGGDKFHGAGYGPVHMRFGRKVNYRIKKVLPEKFINESCFLDIAPDENVVGIFFNIPEVFQIARIGQGIEVYDMVSGVVRQ
jgi:hypothetical protein